MTKENDKKFAVIRTGGKQYKVSEGDIIEVEKIEGEDGSALVMEEVLLIADKEVVEIGHPIIEKAKVSAKILSQEKAEKIIVFKYKAKKNYRKKTGHRQKLTKVQIEKISSK